MRHIQAAQANSRFFLVTTGAMVAITALAIPLAAHAGTPNFVSIVSGDGPSSNLTVDTNDTIVASNAATVSFSTSYDTVNHVSGSPSTPTTGGYNTTPVVGVDQGSTGYTGGPVSLTTPSGVVLTSETISPFDGSTYGGDTGYYDYKVTFSVSSATNQPFMIAGFADGDNEIQDVILDYSASGSTQSGITLGLTALDGTADRTTVNDASHVSFQTNVPALNLAGTHTLDIIQYNAAGPININFGFTAQAVPEPGALFLTGAGFPLAFVVASRRRKNLPR